MRRPERERLRDVVVVMVFPSSVQVRVGIGQPPTLSGTFRVCPAPTGMFSVTLVLRVAGSRVRERENQ